VIQSKSVISIVKDNDEDLILEDLDTPLERDDDGVTLLVINKYQSFTHSPFCQSHTLLL
jgi:hypothetical protein